jgi:hypothetical protein
MDGVVYAICIALQVIAFLVGFGFLPTFVASFAPPLRPFLASHRTLMLVAGAGFVAIGFALREVCAAL